MFCFVLFYSISLSEVSGITETWYLFIQPASINHPISVRTHAGSRKHLLNTNKEWVCVNLSLRMPAVSNYSCPGRGVSGPGTGVLRFYSPSVCSHHAPWRQMVKTSFQQNPWNQSITLLSSMWRTGHLSFTISQSLLKFMSIESVMLFNHLILCHPLLLLPSIFPRIRVFSNESSLKWVVSLHQVVKVLELQLQHQSFQRIFRADFL